MDRQRAVRAVAFAIGAFTVVLGAWAFVHPTSFFERIASYPPYNEHLIHDIGAFQVGIGGALLAALAWSDALRAALVGTGAGLALHAVAHWIDRGEGGRSTDPIGITLIAAAVLLAALWRWTGGEEPTNRT